MIGYWQSLTSFPRIAKSKKAKRVSWSPFQLRSEGLRFFRKKPFNKFKFSNFFLYFNAFGFFSKNSQKLKNTQLHPALSSKLGLSFVSYYGFKSTGLFLTLSTRTGWVFKSVVWGLRLSCLSALSTFISTIDLQYSNVLWFQTLTYNKPVSDNKIRAFYLFKGVYSYLIQSSLVPLTSVVANLRLL